MERYDVNIVVVVINELRHWSLSLVQPIEELCVYTSTFPFPFQFDHFEQSGDLEMHTINDDKKHDDKKHDYKNMIMKHDY